jgi:hypothetical protein
VLVATDGFIVVFVVVCVGIESVRVGSLSALVHSGHGRIFVASAQGCTVGLDRMGPPRFQVVGQSNSYSV